MANIDSLGCGPPNRIRLGNTVAYERESLSSLVGGQIACSFRECIDVFLESFISNDDAVENAAAAILRGLKKRH